MNNSIIKDTLAAYATKTDGIKNNTPVQYQSRQRRYYNMVSDDFAAEYARFSSDYFFAEIEGLDLNNPSAWIPCYIRMADVIRASASLTNEFDGYKAIKIAGVAPSSATKTSKGAKSLAIGTEYLRKGTKIKCMGSTWLVINPANISNHGGLAVIQRCDAVWHYLDYYGNVCTEPLCIGTELLRANDADSQRTTMITKGYFNVRCQYNEATKQIFQNTRMILGSSAYRVTGFSDFIQEFTEDESSVRMLEFTIRYEEPNDAIDDMVNKVAGGKLFKWEVLASGKQLMTAGTSTQLSVTSVRTSENGSETVSNSAEHEISYVYSSSDTDVITVSDEGLCTAVAAGEAGITVALAQNENAKTVYSITVQSAVTTPHIQFTEGLPTNLYAYNNISFSAAYYDNGEETQNEVAWSLSGADKGSYSYTTAGNKITINVWSGSVGKLEVTASYGGVSATQEFILVGI